MKSNVIKIFIGFFLIHFSWLEGKALFQDIFSREIGVKTLVFHDSRRERILICEVYYPNHTSEELKSTENVLDRKLEAKKVPFLAGKSKMPLILFSHGYKGDRFSLDWLQKALASYGFITVSVDHFSGTWYMQDDELALKRWERPIDIQFVLTSMLNDPLFGPYIDQDRIGFVGYTLGGLTGIWLGGGIANQYRRPSIENKDTLELEERVTEAMLRRIDFSPGKKSYRDPRIKAAVLFSPAYGFAFDKEGLLPIQIPLLIVAGENDEIDPRENAIRFAKWIPKAKLTFLKGFNTAFFINRIGNEPLNLPDNFKEIQKETLKSILQFFTETL